MKIAASLALLPFSGGSATRLSATDAHWSLPVIAGIYTEPGRMATRFAWLRRNDCAPNGAIGTPEFRAGSFASVAGQLQRIPVDLIHLVVTRGVDPRIHHLRKTRAKRMDQRVKPAGDGIGWEAPIQADRELL